MRIEALFYSKERIAVLASTVNVLETTEQVRKESKFVRINLEAIKKYCREWSQTPFITPPWDTEVHWDGKGRRLANYILLLDCLNFCFWPDLGQPKWQISYKGKVMGGYQALAASLKRAVENGIPVTDAHWMAEADLKQVKEIFAGIDPQTDIPLLDKRLEHINQTGKVLLDNFGGQFAKAIEEADYNAINLVELLVEYFPSFRDIHDWNGKPIRILKRAQITAVDIYGSFNAEGLGALKDIDRLTVFADYKIPQVMRAMDILEYSPELAAKVDNYELLPSGSREEIEIRVGMIWAAEEIRRELQNLKAPKMAMELDWFLWNLGQQPLPKEKPYHRTRTVFY
ncbi:queuosine salvage family protein [bacterium]|nr:queuosine salvage family protein [bacterium]